MIPSGPDTLFVSSADNFLRTENSDIGREVLVGVRTRTRVHPAHLPLLSFPMTKVSEPSNIFSINALSRNLALKNYSVQPN